MADVEIGKGYLPGAIGRVAELHAIFYQRPWDSDCSSKRRWRPSWLSSSNDMMKNGTASGPPP